jgi:hypothetical protein
MIVLQKPKVTYRELTKYQPDHWTDLWCDDNEQDMIKKMHSNVHLKLEKVIVHENGDVENILLWSNDLGEDE